MRFDDGKAKIAKIKTFPAFGNEAELIEHKTADGGVSRIFGQGDVVLGVQVADVQCGVKNHGAISKGKRFFLNVKFVVNFADHLFHDVFHDHEAKNAAEFIYDHSHADPAHATLQNPLARSHDFPTSHI